MKTEVIESVYALYNSMKQEALVKQCVPDKEIGIHAMNDFCPRCAPFWLQIPFCPKHQNKLKSSGYCVECKKFYSISKEVL